MTEAEKIAASLTSAQRDMVRTGWGSHDTALSPEVYALWDTIKKHSPNDFSITLNSLGLEVRNALPAASKETAA